MPDKKPVVWVGDLNATLRDCDMSHVKYFRDTVYRSIQYAKPKEQGDVGQPGTTLNEQRRLRECMEKGNLLDAHRKLHPNTKRQPEHQQSSNELCRRWTW